MTGYGIKFSNSLDLEIALNTGVEYEVEKGEGVHQSRVLGSSKGREGGWSSTVRSAAPPQSSHALYDEGGVSSEADASSAVRARQQASPAPCMYVYCATAAPK